MSKNSFEHLPPQEPHQTLQTALPTQTTGSAHANSTNSTNSHSMPHGVGTFPGIPFHNPFDFNSYPITNPPIFDSTTMLPYYNEGVPRRRRISISNGQIGQIVSHEAFFEHEFNSSLDDFQASTHGAPLMSNNQVLMNNSFSTGGSVSGGVANVSSGINNLHLYQEQLKLSSYNNGALPRQPGAAGAAAPGSSTSSKVPLPGSSTQNQGVISATNNNNAAAISSLSTAASTSPNSKSSSPPEDGLPTTLSNAAGVPPPNHQLIYNNEVIYNPNNGPIPGTAAWKKERLLERNRIAASKCRQRKKQAQLQLQNNVTKYERELNAVGSRMDKQERMLVFYNRVLQDYFETQDPSHLNILKKFSSMGSVDELSEDDLTLIYY